MDFQNHFLSGCNEATGVARIIGISYSSLKIPPNIILFDYKRRNMQQQHLSTSHLVQSHFTYLLPQPNHSEDSLRIFTAVRDCPMIVPDEDLSSILDLEVSDQNSPPTKEGHQFYVRSWKLEKLQLYALFHI